MKSHTDIGMPIIMWNRLGTKI